MNTGHFYFLKDEYFIKFSDPDLLRNKEPINGQPHNRPCYYAFLDTTTKIYWMVPISSRVPKYKRIYNYKITKFGICDTIVFGEVLGHEKAFLIQNMFPVIPKYIDREYIDKNLGLPVRITKVLEEEITQKARKALALKRKGFNVIFPDVLKIERILVDELSKEK